MKRWIKSFFLFSFLFFLATQTFAFTRGIYLSQETVQDTAKLNYLIKESKKHGVDTFVIDVNHPNSIYAKNVKLVTDSGIHYVARVVIFPGGANHAQVADKRILEKRLALAKYAVKLGASAIQLDYIRYRSAFPADPVKAQKITKVVQYFKNQLKGEKVDLQLDIFGIAAHKPAHTIGQDAGKLATVADALCPMVYPSHFEPFREYAKKPYQTIYDSVVNLKKQIGNNNVDIYAYIELFNYRYPMSTAERAKYITAQMKAAKDAGANGFYVWSASNHYAPLFKVLG